MLCVPQLAKMGYFYLSYNIDIFIIFTEAYNITLTLVYKSSLHLLSLVNFFTVY